MRPTFCLVCLDSRIDLWVSGHNDCLGKSNTVYHLLSISFIDWVDWSQFNQLESVILTSVVWYWSISPGGFGPETKGGSVSFGWHLFCKPRWTASVLYHLVVLEVVCIAHAVPRGFVILWIFRAGGGNQGLQPLCPGSIRLLRSWYHLTAVLGLILWVYWLHCADFCGCFCYCVALFCGKEGGLTWLWFSLPPC